jgi:uncharacterized protein (TIGR00304 family)
MPDLTFVGVAIIFVGFLIVMIAVTMSGSRRRTEQDDGERQETHMRGGGVIMIGPVPIIFGSDAKWTSIAIVLAIVLIVVALLSGILIRQ